jgi:hypothetical protein
MEIFKSKNVTGRLSCARSEALSRNFYGGKRRGFTFFSTRQRTPESKNGIPISQDSGSKSDDRRRGVMNDNDRSHFVTG